MLYVTDPLAIQQILAHDSEPYGLSAISLRYVIFIHRRAQARLKRIQYVGHGFRSQSRHRRRYGQVRLWARRLRLLTPRTGAEHRKQRRVLNPGFSTESIRSYTPIFHGISRKVCHREGSAICNTDLVVAETNHFGPDQARWPGSRCSVLAVARWGGVHRSSWTRQSLRRSRLVR